MPAAAGALFLAALGSCDSDPVVEPEPALQIVPDSVTLTHIGQQFSFSVQGGGTVRWNSLDLAVFTVDEDGTVTARGNGMARVQAWAPESSDQALVHVRQATAALDPFGEGQRAAAGLPLLEPAGVRVLDAGGSPVSEAAVRFEPAPGSGRVEPTEAQSDGAGMAWIAWTLGPSPGRQTLRAVAAEGDASVELEATALDPDEAVASFEVRSGEGQWAWSGRTLAEPIVVLAMDEGGRPVPGAAVRFAPDAGGVADPETVVSDSAGVAVTTWTLGMAPGRQVLAVSAGSDASAKIEATALDPDEAVASFEVRSGEGQWAWSGRTLAEPIVVLAMDEGGRPVPGAAVRFAPDAGGVADPETVVSDSAGVAVTTWTLGMAPGRQVLAVSTGGDASAEIEATALDPDEAVASLEVRSGEDQWAVAGQTLPDPVVVRVTDEIDQPVWGATVRFEPEAGSGGVDPETAMTDSLGLASGVWTLGPASGAQRLAARAADLEVGFGATAVSDQGVCNRTPAVSAVIVERIAQFHDVQVSGCAEVTEEALGRIRLLQLQRKGIARLRSGDFAGLVALEVLYLDENDLTELPADIFDGLSRLRWLGLEDNRLVEMPPGLLAHLGQLQYLSLDLNRLSELPPDIFRDLSRLRTLDLGPNELTQLPADIFDGLLSLKNLYLSHNGLTELPEDVFDGLSNLELLTIRGNELTSLPEGIFSGLSRLGDLRVGDNRLTELAAELFSDVPNLHRLDLERNQLTELPPGLFSETPALQRLFLGHNRLKWLPPGVFEGLPNLFRLALQDNDLAELPPGIFAGTPKLAELGLESNWLEQLPPGLFAGLSELEWVTLHGNTGAPFPIMPEFVRVDGDPLTPGPARVVVKVATGAPFAFSVPLSVQRGTISREAVSLLSGDTVSAMFEVSASAEGGAAHVGFGPLAAVLPEGYEGLALARGEELVLFAESDNRSPLAGSAIPAHRLQAGGPSADLVLADYFDDPDGDSLAYSVETTESRVVAARIEDGVLWLDPLSVDTTAVEVTATDPNGLKATHRFRAWVVPAPDTDAFNIELYFDPGFTAEEEAAVRRAAGRWMEAVVGDLPDVPVQGLMADYCYGESPNLRLVGVIDDVMIRMRMVARQGRNVATARTCGVREASGQAFLGESWFTVWYVRNRGMDDLYESALHEIGHVLGFGYWIYGSRPKSWKDLFRDGDGDGHFAGPLAVAAFDAAGGEGYAGGKVPLEDRIPVLNIHWRKRVIPGDIMAPGGGSLLTAITIQALADLGYEVDVSKADPYTLPTAAQGDAREDGEMESADADVLADDVIEVPVVVVDQDGKVVRIIRP